MFNFIAVPFGMVLKAIYNLVGSYGFAIILFTIFTKLILYPLMLKSKRSMRQMQKLQPKMQELQKRYANNKQKYQEEMAKLYQEEKVNPAGSCLPMLVTLPIMLGLYYVIQQPLTFLMGLSAEEIAQVTTALSAYLPDLTGIAQRDEIMIAQAVFQNFDTVSNISTNLIPINFNFLGINLSQTPSFSNFNMLLLIPVLAGLTAFGSMQVSQKLQGTSTENQPAGMKTTLMLMPLMSVYFGFILPAGVGIYWITGNVLTMVQEFVMTTQLKKEEAKVEEIEFVNKEREKENKRLEMEIKKEEQRRVAEEMKNKK